MRPTAALCALLHALRARIAAPQGPWRPPEDVPRWTAPQDRHAPNLHMVGLHGTRAGDREALLGAMVMEEWAEGSVATADGGRGLLVSGNSRSLLVSSDPAAQRGQVLWTDLSFEKLRLLDRQLSFTVDLSRVGCGCDAAVYLVHMAEVSDSIISSGCE
jgi:hypothetical protein